MNNLMKMTQSGFDRTAKMFQEIAGEQVHVEFFASAFWVLGSELATLRLLKKYRECENASQGYSENRESFYFMLNMEGWSGEF